MKAFTDLEQSKKLAVILPLESADMWWLYITAQGKHIAMMYEEPDPHYLARMESYGIKNAAIPWSLAALLRVIPKHINDYNVLRIDISDKDFAIWYDEIGYGVNDELPNITNESAVDACVNVIITLYEHKLLKKH